MDYIENSIIKLKRQYGKDELVQSLIKKLSESDKKCGMLSSEVDFLKSEFDRLKKDYALRLKTELSIINKEAIKDVRKEEAYKSVLTLNHSLSEKLHERKKENEKLLCQLIKLQK